MTSVCVAAVCPHDQNQTSLDDVLAQAADAVPVLEAAVQNNTLPPSGMSEHGIAAPLGPKQ